MTIGQSKKWGPLLSFSNVVPFLIHPLNWCCVVQFLKNYCTKQRRNGSDITISCSIINFTHSRLERQEISKFQEFHCSKAVMSRLFLFSTACNGSPLTADDLSSKSKRSKNRFWKFFKMSGLTRGRRLFTCTAKPAANAINRYLFTTGSEFTHPIRVNST